MDSRRGMVRFNTRRFSKWAKRRKRVSNSSTAGAGHKKQVLLWTDSFSEYLSDAGARAMVDVLERSGFEVLLPDRQACCGLTWISTGQLDEAKARLQRTIEVLSPYVDRAIPIVGVEPSCTAVLRSDLVDLFPHDERAKAIAAGTRTLAELLSDIEVDVPDLTGRTIVVQPHCHQHSVIGYGADRKLIERTGADVRELAGCCGLAGNFGMEAGHYEVSVAVAENSLLPTLRDAPEGSIFLADGFSCRTQADDLLNVQGVTLAQLLASASTGTEVPVRP